MDFLQYLLPILVISPIMISRTSRSLLKQRLNFLQLLTPVTFLLLTLISYIKHGPIEFTFWKFSQYFSLELRLDVLSGLIAVTVSTIGLVVTRYSVRYLEDDPKKKKFNQNLSYTLCFVLSMLMASNLILFFISWAGTSFYLHQLLTHFSDRSGALKAASQKFWVSRFGDIFIIIAGFILFQIFKSLDFEVMFKTAPSLLLIEKNSLLFNLASLFLVFGAMTKSAQFPFHFWLPNTMDTPTPVSALMHAGIINAGGYLIIRMSPVLVNAPLALSILAIVGSFTAFFASIVMLTQTNIKRSLAYSTIAQMGFMMLQCGLGAFSVAVVHIIGHAFYKAYAFLSSGTLVDFGKLNRYFPKPELEASLWTPFIYAFLSLTIIFGSLISFGFEFEQNPGASILFIILSLAVAQIALSTKDKFKSMTSAFILIFLYLGLTGIMTKILQGIIASNYSMNGMLAVITLGSSSIFFIGLYLIQNNLDRLSETDFGKQMYVKALRGGF